MNLKDIQRIILQDFNDFVSNFQNKPNEIVDRLVRNSKKIENVINAKIKDRKTQNIFKNALTALQYAYDQENNMNESTGSFIKRNMSLVLACAFLLQTFIPAAASAGVFAPSTDELKCDTNLTWYQKRQLKKYPGSKYVKGAFIPAKGTKSKFQTGGFTTKDKVLLYGMIAGTSAACIVTDAIHSIMPKQKADQLKNSKIVNIANKQQKQKASTKKQSGIPSGKRGEYIPGHYNDNGDWIPGSYTK